MDDIYKNIQECNPNKKRKKFNVFDDVTADKLNNKKLNPLETALNCTGKAKHFSCFYCTILFCCTKKYLAKFYTLFYY